MQAASAEARFLRIARRRSCKLGCGVQAEHGSATFSEPLLSRTLTTRVKSSGRSHPFGDSHCSFCALYLSYFVSNCMARASSILFGGTLIVR